MCEVLEATSLLIHRAVVSQEVYRGASREKKLGEDCHGAIPAELEHRTNYHSSHRSLLPKSSQAGSGEVVEVILPPNGV